MPKKISYNDIRNIHEDWALDERNGFPYSGKSVQDFIKKVLNEKGGDFYYDAETNKYLIFADSENRELYLSDREAHADLVIGTFDAPSNYTAEIHLTSPISNVILKGSKGNYIDYTFDIVSKSGSSTGEAVIATYTFNNAGNIKKVTQIYEGGTNVHFLIDEYLSDGANSITIAISGRTTLTGTMAAVNYTVVALEFTSSFNFGVAVEQGDYLEIPYHLSGAGVKYIEWYIDGVRLQDVDNIPDMTVNRTKSIDVSGLLVGKHSVQARAFTVNSGVNFYSATLYFDFVVAPENEIWDVYTTFMLLGLTLSQPVVNDLVVTATQYEDFKCQAAIYDSRGRTLDVVLTDNGATVQTLKMYIEQPQTVTYAPTEVGNHVLVFTVDSMTASITMTVVKGEIDIEEATDALMLKLSAKGRSNTEANPGTWTYNGITTTFTGFSWNAQNGWLNDSLVIPVGGNINIDLAPLAGDVINTGRTIEVDFETLKIADETATILSLINPSTHAGLEITASTAKMVASGGRSVDTKFRDGDRVHLTFIINKTSGDDARMMYIVNNGILERAEQFVITDNFTAGGNMIIGSAGCMVRVHSIRVYNRALSVDEAFCNYAIDNPNLVSIATNNDIFDAQSGEISVDKVNARIPVMIITGDISYILGITDKAQKNAWNPYPVQIEFRNMQNPEMNFFIDDADIRLQGTSSISYPRKNFRIYSESKSGKYDTKFYTPTHNESDLVAGGKYAFKRGSAPVTCWCLKADYAESSGSHNVGVAKLWNTVMYNTINTADGSHPLRTAAQAWANEYHYPYDVRTTIDGFPIVLFQRDNENAPLTCFGQYNFNNDKSTEDVYGFTALKVVDPEGQEHTFDNSSVQCWEVLDSDNRIALFTDVTNFDSGWDDAFEARYPDKNTNVVALKRVSQWINSCYQGMDGETMLLDLQKWQEEKADYFDLPKLAAYYVYLLRFGAVDQTVKNAMFTTYDGLHWFYINYDNDTILGIDNASRLFSVWDYGLKTKTPQGGYYYAGKGMSVLWNCFEADSECIALAKDIDEKLFSAGLTYENMLDIFDTEQSSRWCERIYNANGRYKYIEQALLGQNVLYMLQGSRKSHRHWWLQHRLEKYDNDFGTGTYTRRSIQARATGTVSIPQGATYKFIPAKDANYGYAVASTVVDAPTAREAGVEYTSTGLPEVTGVGNLIYIYNANNLYKLDLSGYISALGTVNLSSAIDVNEDSELRVLVLGDGVNENNFLTNISGLTTIKGLEELDIRGYKAITSLEFEGLPNLHTLRAENSGLTSFVPSSGSLITLAQLPSGLQSLLFEGNTVTAIDYTPTKTLLNVAISNVSGAWDAKSFVNTWLALFTDEELANVSINLTGIDWTEMTVAQLLKIGKVGVKTLRGKVTLVSMTQSDYNDIVDEFGENVFSPESQFIVDAPANMFLSGPTSLLEGESGQFIAAKFPVGEDVIVYKMSVNGSIITPSTDEHGNRYRAYNGVKLYESNGLISVANVSSNTVVVSIFAEETNSGTVSSYIEFTGIKLTYPSSITLSGPSTIIQLGDSRYTRRFDTDSYTARLLSASWSLDDDTFCDITAQDAAESVVTVRAFDVSTVVVNLTYTAVFTNNHILTGTKQIALKYFNFQAIDLDLPSGTLWANANIGADAIEAEGLYFAWGETTGYANASERNAALGRSGGFDSGAYIATGAASIAGNLSLSEDAAHVILGGDWKMPTKSNIQELIDNTDKEYTSINGVNGWKLFSKQNHSRWIFIPCVGMWNENNKVAYNTDGYLYSKTRKDATYAYYLRFDGTNLRVEEFQRRIGLQIRGVNVPPPPAGFVDLDLPSGTLWYNKNVGATIESDYGLFFAWGETTGYANASERNAALGRSGGFDADSWQATGAASIAGNLSSSEDAAHVAFGSPHRMPTVAQCNEVMNTNYVDIETATINGITGLKVMKKSDNSVYVFFPNSGYQFGNNEIYRGVIAFWTLEHGSYNSPTYRSACFLRSGRDTLASQPGNLGCAIRSVC